MWYKYVYIPIYILKCVSFLQLALGHGNESHRFASTARMPQKLPPKIFIIYKKFIIFTYKAKLNKISNKIVYCMITMKWTNCSMLICPHFSVIIHILWNTELYLLKLAPAQIFSAATAWARDICNSTAWKKADDFSKVPGRKFIWLSWFVMIPSKRFQHFQRRSTMHVGQCWVEIV